MDWGRTMHVLHNSPFMEVSQRISGDNLQQALKDSGLNWEVKLQPLQTITGIKVNQYRAAIRMDIDECLGVTADKDYTILQNREAFNFFEPFLTSGTCQLHSAGLIKKGQIIWILAQINDDGVEIVHGDKVCQYLLLANYHNAKGSIKLCLTPHRLRCGNSLAAVVSADLTRLLRVRHSRIMCPNLLTVQQTIVACKAEFAIATQQYKELACKEIGHDAIVDYVKAILQTEKVTRTVDRMVDAIYHSDSDSDKTWWWAYNGVNAYLNYQKGRNTESRLNSLWFGLAAVLNKRALKLALNMKGGIH